MRIMRIFAAGLVAGLAAAVLAASPGAAYELNPDGEFAASVIAITDEVPAPETVIDMADGARTSIDAYPGKVRIVVMWATWCHVCDVEMPILADLARRYEGRKLMVLPVSVDEPPALDLIADHLEKHDLTIFPVMHDRHFALAGRVGLVGTPTTIIVDKFGQVVSAFQGQAPWGDAATDAYLEALLTAETAEASRLLLAGE